MSLGRAYEELGKLPEALAAYQQVVASAAELRSGAPEPGRVQVKPGSPRRRSASLQDAPRTKQFDAEPEALGMIHSVIGRGLPRDGQARQGARAPEPVARDPAEGGGQAGPGRHPAEPGHRLRVHGRARRRRSRPSKRPSPSTARWATRRGESLILNAMGQTYKDAGKPRQGPRLASATRCRSRWSAKTTSNMANRLDQIADIYRLKGQYDDALVYLEQAKSHLAKTEEKKKKGINLEYVGWCARPRATTTRPSRPSSRCPSTRRSTTRCPWPRSTQPRRRLREPGPLRRRLGRPPGEPEHLHEAGRRARHRRGAGAARPTVLHPRPGGRGGESSGRHREVRRPLARRRARGRGSSGARGAATAPREDGRGRGRPPARRPIWPLHSGHASTPGRPASLRGRRRLGQGQAVEAAALAAKARDEAAKLRLRPTRPRPSPPWPRHRSPAARPRTRAAPPSTRSALPRSTRDAPCSWRRGLRSRERSTGSAATRRPPTRGREPPPTSSGSAGA